MKWTNISEKPPPAGGLYLVTDGEEVVVAAYFGEYKGSHDWGSFTMPIDVTHWMHMPQVPIDTCFPMRYTYMDKEQLKEFYPDKADVVDQNRV